MASINLPVFAQGDNLSQLLFSFLIRDLPERIVSRHPILKVLFYAVDLVIYSTSRFHLQQKVVHAGEVRLRGGSSDKQEENQSHKVQARGKACDVRYPSPRGRSSEVREQLHVS